MKAIEHLFGDVFLPQKALLVYRHSGNGDIYVEAYDIDGQGKPVNAHPLALEESIALAKALDSSEALKKDFLKSEGLLPDNVLYIDSQQGFALWHTPPQKAGLLFREQLSIPSGKAHIPALIWKAGKETLEIFAVKGKAKPKLDTPLYHAPFFNLYEDGRVCMGTVAIAIEDDCCLEQFISQWQDYFFDSYFSHMIAGDTGVKYNMVQLWQQQVKTGEPFPEDVLIKSALTIKNLLR